MMACCGLAIFVCEISSWRSVDHEVSLLSERRGERERRGGGLISPHVDI